MILLEAVDNFMAVVGGIGGCPLITTGRLLLLIKYMIKILIRNFFVWTFWGAFISSNTTLPQFKKKA